MRSLDTNVLARFFIDDPDDEEVAKQRAAAIAAVSEPAFVTVTVILEFEWVMRGFYRLSRVEVARVLRALAGIGHIVLEDRGIVLDAVDLIERGMDFADALHWRRSAHTAALVTFDRALYRRAKRLIQPGMTAVELL